MSKLIKIDLDSYKNFFCGEHGLKLIMQIIENDDYDATKQIAKWEKCPSKVLDKIAIKYMVEKEDAGTQYNLKMLENVVENPKISIKMLRQILDYSIRLLNGYKLWATEVLEEIAESKKLTSDMATTLYKVSLEYKLDDVIEELAENKNTPDDILYNILKRFGDKTEAYRNASEEIIKRYKKLKEQLSKENDE